MRCRFDEVDAPSPRYEILVSKRPIPSFGEWKWCLIVKPSDRSGSRVVTKVLNQEQLIHAVNDAVSVSFSKEAVVEEFVTGSEVSVEAISWKGQHYIL